MPTLRTCTTCGHPFAPHLTRQARCDTCRPHGRNDRSPTTRAQRDGTGDYHRNRAALLATHPTCALRITCDGDPATTADHITPVSAGGTNHPSNLAPACAPCNAAKNAARPRRHATPARPRPGRPTTRLT